jgi:DNA-directed RNA polymerase subunit RPC12/RpoP
MTNESSGDDEHSEYQYVCPVCNADSGDFTFENPQKARTSAPKRVECARCGNEVTPAIVDRSVRTDTDQEADDA